MLFRLLLLAACLIALEAKLATPGEPTACSHRDRTDTETTTADVVTVLLENVKKNNAQMFIGEISVGTPPQVMKANFDVSQPLAYVPSKKCDDPVCVKPVRYDSSASTSYQEDGTEFELGYGQNVSGILSTDAVSFGGITIQNQTFGEATSITNIWYYWTPNDGVVGLGFGSSAVSETPTVVDNMVAQGLIQRRLFGLWLGRAPDGGELTLGGINEDRYRGDMLWVNVTQPARAWQIQAQGIALDGHSEAAFCDNGCPVLMSTGLPYFLASMEVAETINDALGGVPVTEAVPGFKVLDCTTLCHLPTLNITIGGQTMEMSPLEYTVVYRPEEGLQMCASGFVGLPEMGDTWMFGTLFMQKFYTAYDMENERLGFADSV